MRRLAVLGQGYVGVPVALQAVARGFDVVGYDPDVERIRLLQEGRSFLDDVDDDEVARALSTGRYRLSIHESDLRDFDVALIAVPTPLTDGAPDLTHVRAAALAVAKALTPGALVVLESTSYPGTTEHVVGPLLSAASGLVPGVDFSLAFSPERIDPGNGEWNLEATPKIVSGVGPGSLEAATKFYQALVRTVVPVANPTTAELAKLIENTFRHVNIAMVNEIAMFAGELGIDVWDALDAAGTKPFGFLKFTPGPGVGGHCLPVDPQYLSWFVRRELGHSLRFIELADDINARMPNHVADRVAASLNDQGRGIKGTRVLLLGLAYKRNSGDLRHSPAMRVSELLRKRGAVVRAVDPFVAHGDTPDGVDLVPLTADEVAAADLVVTLVDHDAFDYDLVLREGRAILDCRNRLPTAPHVNRL